MGWPVGMWKVPSCTGQAMQSSSTMSPSERDAVAWVQPSWVA
jgi:hypothetical protein